MKFSVFNARVVIQAVYDMRTAHPLNIEVAELKYAVDTDTLATVETLLRGDPAANYGEQLVRTRMRQLFNTPSLLTKETESHEQP